VAKSLGRHLIVELFGCDRSRLNDEDQLRTYSVAAAEAMGATVIGVYSHRFSPVGVSVVVVLAESHLAVHTWPEHRAASLDVFVCNPAIDPIQAKNHLADHLKAEQSSELELERGKLGEMQRGSWRHEKLTSSL